MDFLRIISCRPYTFLVLQPIIIYGYNFSHLLLEKISQDSHIDLITHAMIDIRLVLRDLQNFHTKVSILNEHLNIYICSKPCRLCPKHGENFFHFYHNSESVYFCTAHIVVDIHAVLLRHFTLV